jgi:CheY-like chemotaxis protein
MGGRLDVESEPGSGSVFSCTLPFMRAPEAPTVVGVDLAGTRVLVVDDNDTLREILGRWLTAWRARPTLVGGGDAARTALERARAAGTPFGLVLVAIATEGSAALIADPRDGTLGVVVMLPPTGATGVDTLPNDRVVGVRKPVGPDQLRAALGTALTGRGGTAPVFPHARRTTRPLRVLVAEDSLTNLAIASALLERWGHTVTRAGNGRDAVAAVHDGVYDLVLMDVQMPGVDGLEATRMIRAGEGVMSPRVPIVAMTASAMRGDRERCLQAGMDGYLAKPIDADELFETVERFAAPALRPVPRA